MILSSLRGQIMKQGSLSEVGFVRRKCPTRRAVFLEQMEQAVPWGRFEALILPHYPVAGRGLLLREGTMVDATLIAAPPSTRNRERKRDPEMSQTKKGNQWHFGMKLHVGADAQSGLSHSADITTASVHDAVVTETLLHGAESIAFGDRG
jgi:IS5 family transposase